MNELMNPRVPGLGLAPSIDVERLYEDARERRMAALVRTEPRGLRLRALLDRLVKVDRPRPRARVHRPAHQWVPIAKA